MNITPTPLKNVVIVETNKLADHRGSFARLFCNQELSPLLGNRQIVQINQSLTTTKGAIRGMHFQYPPYAEMKMVRCIRGKVFDVAVDLRANSETFLQWHAELLTPENARMFVIPEGCAHGFQTLEPDTELLYLHTAHYAPKHEGGVLYNDPMIGIQWPIECTEISNRDREHTKIDTSFSGINV